MKKIVNPIIKKIVANDITWTLCSYLLRFAEWLKFERSLFEKKQSEKKLKEIFSDLRIRDGYFKGLKYPAFSSFGSSLFPKLSGSYEAELYHTLKSMESKPYQSIIDIGCAEGFYAVGLALKFTATPVLAFDIDETARNMCKEMAIFNQVEDRVKIAGACTASTLSALDGNTAHLVICDCEGYERFLFDHQNVPSLVNSDLIIELHPFMEKDVVSYLSQLFGTSHHISLISSHNNDRKMTDLPNKYDSFSRLEKLILVEEGRPYTMDWMILLAK